MFVIIYIVITLYLIFGAFFAGFGLVKIIKDEKAMNDPLVFYPTIARMIVCFPAFAIFDFLKKAFKQCS